MKVQKGRLELTMKNLTYLLAVALIIVLFAMSSCATTTTTSVWKDPAYQGKINK
jgi:outer membrane protein assembly factor BamE (lipoprotein component of BamABCDE complex)